MKFYIVRHGQTLFNQKGIIQGWCDSPLTEQGIQQARNVAYGLKDIPFTCAACSISERAWDTASIIVEGRAIQVHPRKDLKEVHFGTLEGERLTHGEFFPLMEKGFTEYEGETVPEASKRFLHALKEIGDTHTGNVLIVAHGAVIAGVLMAISKGTLSFEDMHLENCSVSIVDYTDNTFTIEQLPTGTYREKGEKAYGIS